MSNFLALTHTLLQFRCCTGTFCTFEHVLTLYCVFADRVTVKSSFLSFRKTALRRRGRVAMQATCWLLLSPTPGHSHHSLDSVLAAAVMQDACVSVATTYKTTIRFNYTPRLDVRSRQFTITQHSRKPEADALHETTDATNTRRTKEKAKHNWNGMAGCYWQQYAVFSIHAYC